MPDSFDKIPYKAHIVADEDYFDMLDEIDRHIETIRSFNQQDLVRAVMEVRSVISRFTRRSIFQCPRCNRLYIDDPEMGLHPFISEEESPPVNLLRSGKYINQTSQTEPPNE